MKSQVLLTVWCNISGEAAGEIWHWSLSGVKGLILVQHLLWQVESIVEDKLRGTVTAYRDNEDLQNTIDGIQQEVNYNSQKFGFHDKAYPIRVGIVRPPAISVRYK